MDEINFENKNENKLQLNIKEIIIENTNLESSDEEEIRVEPSSSKMPIVEERKEPPKFTMITRSRALMGDMEIR